MSTDLSKVSGLYIRRLRRLNYADLINRGAQDRRIDLSGRCDFSSGVVGGLLQKMSDVSASPFPADLVPARGAIESFPPRQVCFTSKTSVHGFDDVAGICKNADLTRLAQRLQTDRCRRDLGLLVRCAPEIFADRTPETFVSEQCDACRARRLLPVAETRAVAKNCYLLKCCHASVISVVT